MKAEAFFFFFACPWQIQLINLFVEFGCNLWVPLNTVCKAANIFWMQLACKMNVLVTKRRQASPMIFWGGVAHTYMVHPFTNHNRSNVIWTLGLRIYRLLWRALSKLEQACPIWFSLLGIWTVGPGVANQTAGGRPRSSNVHGERQW